VGSRQIEEEGMDQPTCGKGLAANSVLPEKMGQLIAALARILELHTKALDVKDDKARKEYDAYVELAHDHGRIAADLQRTAGRMAGYRDLPMGRHDARVLHDPVNRQAFEEFMKLESELVALFQVRLEDDRKMLDGM
jgi:hypothetical protein